jgi:hypothetical protein
MPQKKRAPDSTGMTIILKTGEVQLSIHTGKATAAKKKLPSKKIVITRTTYRKTEEQ